MGVAWAVVSGDGNSPIPAGGWAPGRSILDVFDRGDVLALIPRLRRFAGTLVDSPGEAQRLVDQAMERASRGRAANGRWTNGHWEQTAFAAVKNLSRERTNRNPRDANAAAPSGSELEVADGVPFAGVPQGTALVRRNFERLPAEYREVLLLVCVEGFSYGKTAQILDVPAETLVKRLVNARFLLHRLIAEDGTSGGSATGPELGVERHERDKR